MDKSKKIRIFVSFLVIIVGFYYVFTGVAFSDVFQVIKGLNPLMLLGFFSVQLFITLLMSYRWKCVIGEKGVDLGLWDSFRYYNISFFVNFFLPARAGDLYRGYLSSKKDFIDSSLIVLKERLFDLIVLMFFFSVLVITIFESFTGYLAILFMVLLAGIFTYFFIEKKEELPVLNNWYVLFRSSFIEAVKTKRKTFYLLFTAGIWLVEVLKTYIVFYGLGIESDLFLIAFFTFSWSLVAAIPISPSGLGSSEALTLFILVSYGILRTEAVSLVLMYRGLLVTITLIVGGSFYVRDVLKNTDMKRPMDHS